MSRRLQLYSLVAAFITALLTAAVVVFFRHDAASSFPIPNPKRPLELSTCRSVLKLALAGREVLLSALKKFGPRLFRIHTDNGTMIILRPEHGEEIRNDPRFSVDVPIIETWLALESPTLIFFRFFWWES